MEFLQVYHAALDVMAKIAVSVIERPHFALQLKQEKKNKKNNKTPQHRLIERTVNKWLDRQNNTQKQKYKHNAEKVNTLGYEKNNYNNKNPLSPTSSLSLFLSLSLCLCLSGLPLAHTNIYTGRRNLYFVADYNPISVTIIMRHAKYIV